MNGKKILVILAVLLALTPVAAFGGGRKGCRISTKGHEGGIERSKAMIS